MRDTLRRICDLQSSYSSVNTLEMRERGNLIRHDLANEIRSLREPLVEALGDFGDDFFVEGSDGKGRKTELAWTRFCSREMSPSATQGFYAVLHFSTNGSGVNIVVGCSSSKFSNGSNVVLPLEDVDKRCDWARKIVLEGRGSLEPFSDRNEFGARSKLPRSFERASALVKKIEYDKIEDDVCDDSVTDGGVVLVVVVDMILINFINI